MPYVIAVEGLILIGLLVVGSMVENAPRMVKTCLKAAVGVMMLLLLGESFVRLLA